MNPPGESPRRNPRILQLVDGVDAHAAGLQAGHAGSKAAPRIRGLPDTLHQCIHVAGEGVMVQHAGLQGRQPDQIRRQCLAWWHHGLIHQQRNDTHVTRQGRTDLDAHPVIRLVQAAAPILVGSLQPAWPDHHQAHVAGTQGALDFAGKIVARTKALHVDEDLVAGEGCTQAIVEPPRKARTVVPPVADEDTCHDSTPESGLWPAKGARPRPRTLSLSSRDRPRSRPGQARR